MTSKDIIALANAGFTKDEIAKMAQALQPEAPKPAEDPKPEPEDQKPAEDPKPEPEDPKPAEDPKPSSIEQQLLSELLDLKQTVLNQNVNNSRMPADPASSLDNILESIINPYKEDEK